MDSDWTSEDECKTTIKSCFEENNYLLDPHTAVGLNVARKRATKPARKLLLTATAHYGKFGRDVLLAVGKTPNSETPCGVFKQLEGLNAEPEMNESLRNAMEKPDAHYNVCAKDLHVVKQEIEDFLMNVYNN